MLFWSFVLKKVLANINFQPFLVYGDTKLCFAVLPLLLCAFAFCGYLYLRRKRSALSR